MRIPTSVPTVLTLVLSAAAVGLLITAVVVLSVLNRPPDTLPEYGITYSTVYAEQLGIPVEESYTALLDDMGVRRVRLPIYWDQVEREKDVYSWDQMDRLIKLSEERGALLTLVVGQKVPRWPECYIPDWAEHMDPTYAHDELLEFMELVVERYKSSPAVERWQVENEAFFPFGECPEANLTQFSEELSLVRSLDDKPIQLTVSGELEPYLDAAIPADVLGVSLYRETWNDFFGYFYYPVTPGFYKAKIATVKPLVHKVVISELQAEPWFPEPIATRTPAEWYAVFTAEDLRRNVDFANRTEVSEVYLWGAEWWYYLNKNGESGLWNVAKEIFGGVL